MLSVITPRGMCRTTPSFFTFESRCRPSIPEGESIFNSYFSPAAGLQFKNSHALVCAGLLVVVQGFDAGDDLALGIKDPPLELGRLAHGSAHLEIDAVAS